MDEANPGPAVLRALAADRGLRRILGRSLRARLAGGAGARRDRRPRHRGAAHDLPEPAADPPSRRLDPRRRGAEPGSCGRPLAEQRAVVEEKLEIAEGEHLFASVESVRSGRF